MLCCVFCFVCLCLVSFVPNVASFSGLSILDYPPSVSVTFICLVSCVPNVASFSGLSILDYSPSVSA